MASVWRACKASEHLTVDRQPAKMDNRRMSKNIIMRTDNKGLTVKINLFSMETFIDELTAQRAREWMSGQATNAATNEVKKFHDAGELLTILVKWNRDIYKKLKSEKRQKTGS